MAKDKATIQRHDKTCYNGTKTRVGEHKYDHMKWPSFQNVHRLFGRRNFNCEDEVIALEKIDGSNLGIEINPENEKLVALHGRNQLLWHIGMEKSPFFCSYGNARSNLQPLQEYIPRLVNFSRALLDGCERGSRSSSVVVFGEWHQKDVASKPTWFPFGYRIRGDHGPDDARTMTSHLYQMLLTYGLTPSKLLYSGGGGMDAAIEALFPMMYEPADKCFEGVFITRANVSGINGCAKWKTGYHEEQPKFILTDDDATVSPETLHLLRLVYDTRWSLTRRKMGSTPCIAKSKTQPHASMRHQMRLAFKSVLTKSSLSNKCIQKLDKKSRTKVLSGLVADALEDANQQYEKVGENMPKEMESIAWEVADGWCTGG